MCFVYCSFPEGIVYPDVGMSIEKNTSHSSNYSCSTPLEQVVSGYETDTVHGLSDREAGLRLARYGRNGLEEKKRKPILRMFLEQLNDLLIYVLIGAVIITALMGEYIDAVIIMVVVMTNATLGVIQEVRARQAIDALKTLAAPQALVKRQGQVQEVNAELLVPGDLVILEAGRYVPADLRLTESANLKIDESALTGESVAVEKDYSAKLPSGYIALGDRVNTAYMSTLVTYGRGAGIVTQTGQLTEVGKIAGHLKSGEEVKTPLEIRLGRLGASLGKGAILICVAIFLVALVQGRDLAETFLTAVSLAVAAIPEGLVAIVAIVLSVGVTKMARQQAIIRKLPAVETLGSVNIVCSDKTGTLTQNKMVVQEVFTFTDKTLPVDSGANLGDDAELLASAMVLASDATLEEGGATGDPTEVALLHLADQIGLDRKKLLLDQPRMDELAFDSDRKMMSTFHRQGEKYVVYTKGAVDHLILNCKYVLENGEKLPLSEAHKQRLMDASEEMADKALRTLAVAYKPVENPINPDQFEQGLIMIGLVGMFDPPRLEVKESIATAKAAGITTIMITGDHKNTALAIARELGIASDLEQATTGREIDHLPVDELADHIDGFRVFARVSPVHKVNIIKALKLKSNVVSMTGDGVNDAPALYAADIGVAMGITGTDVAKNASDMVLADDNFSTIIRAIEEGRNIYNNIKKSVLFLLSSNVGEVLCMFAAIVAGLPLPLIATQLLWINLITDTLPAIALGMDPGNPEVMQEKPRPVKEGFFSGGGGYRVLFTGFLIGVLTLVAFLLGYQTKGFDPFSADTPEEVHEYSRTLAFLTIIACQLFISLSFRDEKRTFFSLGVFGNKILILAVIIGFGLQCVLLYIPVLQEAFRLQAVGPKEWLWVLGLGIVPMIISEVRKTLRQIFYSGR